MWVADMSHRLTEVYVRKWVRTYFLEIRHIQDLSILDYSLNAGNEKFVVFISRRIEY
jgi:hypothetical protein